MTECQEAVGVLADDALDRYSRQILVPGFDLAGQERLASSTVVIVGCGGLGCPLSMYLAAAGVGAITLFDDDVIEASNLPRQVAFTENDVGARKAEVLATRLVAMNSGITVLAQAERFTLASGVDAVADCDLVLDASDSRETRLAIDAVTQEAGKPWVMGAAIQMTGQWLAFQPRRDPNSYRNLAPAEVDAGSGGCSGLGVLGPVVGSVAMQQAMMALVYLAGGDLRWGELTVMDYRHGERQTLQLSVGGD